MVTASEHGWSRHGRSAVHVVLAVAGIGILLAGCGTMSNRTAHGAAVRMTMTLQKCGRHWAAPKSGSVTFAVTNRFYQPMDVYLASAATGAVYAELEGLGVGATYEQSVRALPVPVLPQRRASDPRTLGPVVHVHDTRQVANATPGVRPVTEADLMPPAKQYQA